MTRVLLLDCLKEFTEDATRDIILPVREQKEDGGQAPPPRPATVYRMRLDKSSAAQKVAPYILHQIITGKDAQPEGTREASFVVVRTIFSVYHENEQEGALALLVLMERLRIALLKRVVIGNQFQLDLQAGLETIIYPDDLGSYAAGEMISTWKMPGVNREVGFN